MRENYKMKNLLLAASILTLCSCINSNAAQYQKVKIKKLVHYKVCNTVLNTCKKYKTKKQFNRILKRITDNGLNDYYSAFKGTGK